jgi:hypothetical protein
MFAAKHLLALHIIFNLVVRLPFLFLIITTLFQTREMTNDTDHVSGLCLSTTVHATCKDYAALTTTTLPVELADLGAPRGVLDLDVNKHDLSHRAGKKHFVPQGRTDRGHHCTLPSALITCQSVQIPPKVVRFIMKHRRHR